MDSILSFLGTAASGGILGILGSGISGVLKYFSDKQTHKFKLEEKKIDHEYSLSMVKAQTDATIAEVNANIERDRINTEGAIDIIDAKTRGKSLQSDNEPYVHARLLERMMFDMTGWVKWITAPIAFILVLSHSLVDMSRTLVRVVVTYGSVAFSSYILWYSLELYQKLGGAIDTSDVLAIIMVLLKLVTFTTSTALGYWFADKSMSRKFQEAYKK